MDNIRPIRRKSNRTRSRPRSIALRWLEALETRRHLAAHIVGSSTTYSTIQAAVNAAVRGSTITVDAGSYAGKVTINKQLTLLGAQAGVDARTRSGAESIITGTTQGNGISTVFSITASDVTLDGFTISGQTTQSVTTGAGIVIAAGVSGTHVTNSIIQNNVSGVFLANASAADPAVFRHNLFNSNNNNGTDGGRGIYTDTGITGGSLSGVVIDANTFYNNHGKTGTTFAEAGVSFEGTVPGCQSNIQITNNRFDSNGKAVLFFCTSNVLFQGNTVTEQTDTASNIRFEGGDSNIQILDNDVYHNNGNAIAIDSKAVPYNNSNFTIERNNFLNNSLAWGDRLSVIVEKDNYDGTLDATNNWWGDATGPGGQGSGVGDKIYGDGFHISGAQWSESFGSEITFSNWATTAFTWSIPPAVPTLAATASLVGTTASVNLNWMPSTGTPIRYELERSIDGVTFTTLAVLPPTTLAFTDNNVAAGSAYYYQICAENLAGASAYTPSGLITTTPVPVTNLASLNWTSATIGYGTVHKDASLNGSPLTLAGTTYSTGIGTHAASTIVYNLAGLYTTFNATVGIDAEEDGKGEGSVDFKVIGDGVTLFDSGVLTNDQARAISVSVAGVQSLSLVATNGIPGSIDYDHADWAGAVLIGNAVAPTAPTNLTATGTGSSAIKLKWTAGSSNLTSYTIDRSIDGSTFATIATGVAANSTTYTDNSVLSSATTYYYRIRAVNGVGQSANSNVASAATLPLVTVTYVSDLQATSATIGYGTIQQDKSIKGNPLTLNGVVYAKGIGTHAVSSIAYDLAGKYSTFLSDVGVDDEENGVGLGSVDFQVLADGRLIFDSGVVHNGDPTVSINVNITGVQTLTLVATNGVADNIDYDHADWAGAQLLA